MGHFTVQHITSLIASHLTHPLPFSTSCGAQYGKDFYYRAHPADLQEFYAAIDDFHRYYDVVTEFDSLSGVASELMPGMHTRSVSYCGSHNSIS